MFFHVMFSVSTAKRLKKKKTLKVVLDFRHKILSICRCSKLRHIHKVITVKWHD